RPAVFSVRPANRSRGGTAGDGRVLSCGCLLSQARAAPPPGSTNHVSVHYDAARMSPTYRGGDSSAWKCYFTCAKTTRNTIRLEGFEDVSRRMVGCGECPMKTGSVLAGLMMASALLIGGCGQSTEPPKDQPKKPAEAPPTPPMAPTATEPAPGGAMAPAGTAPAGMVKGDLLRIEGDFYVVKDD